MESRDVIKVNINSKTSFNKQCCFAYIQDFFSSSLHGVMDAIREVNRNLSALNFVSIDFVAAKFRSEATLCSQE